MKLSSISIFKKSLKTKAQDGLDFVDEDDAVDDLTDEGRPLELNRL